MLKPTTMALHLSEILDQNREIPREEAFNSRHIDFIKDLAEAAISSFKTYKNKTDVEISSEFKEYMNDTIERTLNIRPQDRESFTFVLSLMLAHYANELKVLRKGGDNA